MGRPRLRWEDDIRIDLEEIGINEGNWVDWAEHVARMEEGRRAFKMLTGKHTGKKPLGRPRPRWEDNIRIDLEEVGINAGNWVDSAQDRDYWRTLVNAGLNIQVP